MRSIGVFERQAVDAMGTVVSLFENFVRDQFSNRVEDAEAITRKRGNVFQRLDDSADLFAAHASIDLVHLASPAVWERLKRAFATRHLLLHRGGIVDQRYLDAVPDSGLSVGQRIVIRRDHAEAALADLRAVVMALDST